jgi:hypothetical protein
VWPSLCRHTVESPCVSSRPYGLPPGSALWARQLECHVNGCSMACALCLPKVADLTASISTRSPLDLHSISTRSPLDLVAAQVPFEDIPRLPAILEAMRPAELRAKREPMSRAREVCACVWPASLTSLRQARWPVGRGCGRTWVCCRPGHPLALVKPARPGRTLVGLGFDPGASGCARCTAASCGMSSTAGPSRRCATRCSERLAPAVERATV